MKKRRVPAALHFELTEYASLLRALRTRDAMDLSAHLTKPSPFTLSPQNNALELNDELLDDSPFSSPAPVNSRENAVAEQTSKKVAHKRKRDQWTRWPLLLEDVPVPEWTLEDEVAVIASRIMKTRSTPTFPVSEGPLEHDDPSHTDYVMNTEFEEDDPDHPFYVPYLTSTIASLLSTIFSLLAKHTPARPASMQNRIEPLNWRSIIDVIVACDSSEFSNPKVVENVIRRMEAIFGPSFSPLDGKMATSYRAAERIKNKEAAADRIHNLLHEPVASFFSQASPLSYKGPPSLKRKRDPKLTPSERNYKVRKRSKAKGDQDHQMKYNNGSQGASGHSKLSQEPVRRNTRAKSKVNHNVLSNDEEHLPN